MRFRSVAVFLGSLSVMGALAASLVRCALPDLPLGPQALPTNQAFIHGAVLALPSEPFDHAALIASLMELKVTTVILQSAADATGEHVADRVALAVELQQALQGLVFVGSYQSNGLGGKPMDALLATDPTFTSCYPGGLALDATSTIIDKLVTCSADVSAKVATALQAANASKSIGCFITHQPLLVAGLDPAASAKLASLFHDSAAACVLDGRNVAISSLLAPGAGDPGTAGVFFRSSLQDSGVNVLMLQDGVSQPDASTRRAFNYYQGLRNALTDREQPVVVWANIEAFACGDSTCTRTVPASTERFIGQLCAARRRVDGILGVEYLGDLAGRSFVDAQTPGVPDAAMDATDDVADADPDAAVDASSPDDAAADAQDDGAAQAALDEADAAAQLRTGYLQWMDAGGPCP